MTVSTQTAKSQYTGNGVTVAFTGSFPILDEDHATVILTTALGVSTTQTITTDYTISGVGGSTFTVTFLTAPASGVRVTIARAVPLTQELDLVENSVLPSAELEKSYDKVTMIAQQVNEAAARSLRFPVSDASSLSAELPSSVARASKVLGFTSTGAVTVSTVDLEDLDALTTDAAAAAASAAAAAASASAAATARTNAETAETNAETAETNAETAQAAAEAAAGAVGLQFTFDSSTSMADPGTGDFRFNNATVASVTAIALDDTTADAGNPDLSAFIATWDDSTNTTIKGTLTIRKRGTPATFAIFSVTGLTDNSGWTELAVTHVASNGSWSAADVAYIQFSRAGNKGADGVGSVASVTAGNGTITVGGTATDPTVAVAANGIALSNLARVGTAGHVLTSNGAGADPSYQAISGSADTTARDMAATAMIVANAAATPGTKGPFYLVDAFLTDTLATKTNATYDATNDWYENLGSYGSVASDNPTSAAGTYSGFTFRIKVPASAISANGSSVKVTLKAGTSNLIITNCYIGHKASSGNAWDFDGSQVRVTFDGGSNGTTVTASGTKQSDAVSFSLDETKDLLVAYDISGSVSGNPLVQAATSGWDWHYKSGAAEAGTTAPSGYTTSANNNYSVSDISVAGTPPNMTLRPTSATLATASPSDALAYFVVDPVDSLTMGTDVLGKVSIDGGSTYATGTWTKVGDWGSTLQIWRLDADVDAQTGSSLVWSIETANNKQIRVKQCGGVVPIY